MGQALGFRMKTRDCIAKRGPGDARKEMKRLIYIAFETGGKVSFSLSQLIESRVSLKVLRAVYRSPSER